MGQLDVVMSLVQLAFDYKKLVKPNFLVHFENNSARPTLIRWDFFA